MKPITYVFRFMRQLMWVFVLEGVLSLIVAILILLYPNILPYVVAFLITSWALVAWYVAAKIKKYSTLTIGRKK